MFVGPFTFDSRSVSRLFDKNFNSIVLKEVLLNQQRLIKTFNFIIIPPPPSSPPATKLLEGILVSSCPSVEKSYGVRQLELCSLESFKNLSAVYW